MLLYLQEKEMKALYLSEIAENELEVLRDLLKGGILIEAIEPDRKQEILERAGEFDVVIGARLGREFLEKAKNLKYFIIPFAGIPPQDMEILPDFPGITVMNSHFNARYVAEHAWALLLASVKRLCQTHEKLKRGDWTPRYEHQWSRALAVGRELAGMAKAFGLTVKAVKRNPGEAPEIDFLGTPEDLPGLLPEADYIIVSLPGTQAAKGLIGSREFDLMKDGVHIVNVGRGTVIDEDAFYEALESGKLGGAGIDTWWVYPKDSESRAHTFPSRHPVWEHENVVFSPHRASHVSGREPERIRDMARLLNSIAAGKPVNVVNIEEGY
jgi:phosphoglycerate dehydrogenase-like enzyme